MTSGLAPSVSSLYADSLAAFLRERGVAPVVTAPNTGASSSAMAAPRVHGQAYALALQHGARALGDAGLGLAFGTRVGGAGFGMLGVAAVTAPTLRQSIRHLMRLEALTSTLGHVAPRRAGDQVHLEWRPVQPLSPAVIEGILAGWVSFGRYFLGERAGVTSVSFAHSRGAPLQSYESTFECPVQFATGRYSVTVPVELLDARPRHADATLNAAIDAWLGDCVSAIVPSERALTRRIADSIGQQIPFAEADESSVAGLLGMTRRTLQRRLQLEGTNYRQVLDAARAQHAIIGVLKGNRPLVDLVADAGFSEQSSLCRSFRKWTGYSPLAFQRKLGDVFQPLR